MDIRDFMFRDQLEIISPNCETSFLFRDTPELLPLTVVFNFRDQGDTVPPSPCGSEETVWVDPNGDTWVTPDGEGWEAVE